MHLRIAVLTLAALMVAAPKLAAEPVAAPPPGQTVRLAGDPAIQPEVTPDGVRLPELGLLVEAPLPKGYPPPTPPGMLELKTYPSVRRAEISAAGAPNIGMNFGFFPLFNHIKARNIAMTSPVEIDYEPPPGLAPLDSVRDAQSTWTMSFLYRTPDLGPTGDDGRISVVDTPEVTVIAVGMRGRYGTGTVNAGLRQLQEWFAGQSDWEPAGPPRGLNYNGPQVRTADKWSEVQVPIQRANPAD